VPRALIVVAREGRGAILHLEFWTRARA
jgi:hypothetical protein